MRVFKNGWFQKFARKEKISDAMLCEAVARAERGQIDADLGAGLIKQRVARPGAGKSGGFRALVIFRAQTRAVFAFGFAKSDMANLDAGDEAYMKKAAKLVLEFTDAQMKAEVDAGRMLEVKCDDKDLQE
ncbi:type II toxin-antitoxin system RelE/ParE family toxin [Agrobacterium vitis]|uniref:type II toxin-antitoxin system RelE/ParE family toxin n=1 Tax=Allorhizobium ampelinum TaxID=3025782 RepID=UPI001F2A7F26|nr:type II toxin-antitoxin system RelE/ParE family toxin [Allorhizobium ampelinum]